LAHFLHTVYLGMIFAYVRPFKHCLDILTFPCAKIFRYHEIFKLEQKNNHRDLIPMAMAN